MPRPSFHKPFCGNVAFAIALAAHIPWSFSSAVAEEVRFLAAECERHLALAAAPEHLRAGAGVFLLTPEGVVQDRESENGFNCIVNRDHPAVLKPVCYDAEGSRTVLEKTVRSGNLLADGVSAEELQEAIRQDFSEGRYETPGPGVAYMLSHYNRPVNPGTGELSWFPPHVMFYAPDLEQADVGFDPATYSEQIHLPFVGYQGPHGFMIVRAEAQARPQDNPLPESCPAWVSE